MKILQFLFLLFMISASHADESNIFTYPPQYLTNTETIAAITQAAEKRKWTASKPDDNHLQLKLESGVYRADLLLSISQQEIRYTDHTKYLQAEGEDEDETWSASSVPVRWINNLRNDVSFIFFNKRKSPAKDIKLLTNTPNSISTKDAVEILKYVSKNRKWMVSNVGNGMLQIKLNLSIYKAVLDFSITGNEITYRDSTLRFIDAEEDNQMEKVEVPRNWLTNLRNDVIKILPLVQNIKNRNNAMPAKIGK